MTISFFLDNPLLLFIPEHHKAIYPGFGNFFKKGTIQVVTHHLGEPRAGLIDSFLLVLSWGLIQVEMDDYQISKIKIDVYYVIFVHCGMHARGALQAK